jgi:hypothetical protein
MRVGILGTGNVGQALARGLVRNHEVRLGSRAPEKVKAPPGVAVGPVREVADWAETVILAVPYRAVKEALVAAGPALVKGRILIDATNAIAPSQELAVGFRTSGAEEIAQIAPGARVAKAFNTVFASSMSTGKVAGTPLTVFVAADDPKAKEAALRLARDIGFDAVDAGPLRSARLIEPIAMLMINMGYGLRMGTEMGLRLVRKA